MKFVILLSFITLAWSNHLFSKIPLERLNSWDELTSPFRNECLIASGAEPLDTLNIFVNMHFPDKLSFKCYLKCLYQRLKFMDENGVIDTEEVVSKVNGANIELVQECELTTRNITDLCEKVYSAIMCGMEKINKLPKI